MLARSRLPEKQKAIYAGRQHCQYSYTNTEKSIETKHENGETKPENGKIYTYHFIRFRPPVSPFFKYHTESRSHFFWFVVTSLTTLSFNSCSDWVNIIKCSGKLKAVYSYNNNNNDETTIYKAI